MNLEEQIKSRLNAGLPFNDLADDIIACSRERDALRSENAMLKIRAATPVSEIISLRAERDALRNALESVNAKANATATANEKGGAK